MQRVQWLVQHYSYRNRRDILFRRCYNEYGLVDVLVAAAGIAMVALGSKKPA